MVTFKICNGFLGGGRRVTKSGGPILMVSSIDCSANECLTNLMHKHFLIPSVFEEVNLGVLLQHFFRSADKCFVWSIGATH